MLWMEETKEVIWELEYKYQDQIYLCKSCTQSGFQKRKYPSFDGNVLSYYEFKEHWKEEVSPEQKPEVFKVNALKDQVPLTAKNKLHKIKSLKEAWNILDKLYGQMPVIWSKLKGKILSLQIKATKSPEREIELFDSIQYISSRIKAAGGHNMLEVDQEYIVLVSKHLKA